MQGTKFCSGKPSTTNSIISIACKGIAFMFLFVILSCASWTPFGTDLPFNDVNVAPEYKRLGLLSERHLAVHLTQNELAVGNGPDVAEDIPKGDAEKVYLQFFAEELPRVLQNHSIFTDAVSLTWSYDTTNF